MPPFRMPSGGAGCRNRQRATFASVAVWPGGDIDLVALGVGQCPPLRRTLVIDYVAAGRKRRRDAHLRLVVRHIDIDMDPVALRARRVHLLEPERRPLELQVEQTLVANLPIA